MGGQKELWLRALKSVDDLIALSLQKAETLKSYKKALTVKYLFPEAEYPVTLSRVLCDGNSSLLTDKNGLEMRLNRKQLEMICPEHPSLIDKRLIRKRI